ncbi:MAG TPA: hypothetical protein VMD74_05175, partial [Candidatus Methylomirabilis sp.]|nr:hypothetical protein [Candidatus Methylomirabilis sp.]
MPISKKNKLPRRIIFIKEGVIGFTLGAFVVLGVFVYALYTLAAWSNPTQPPTGGNVDAPVNIGLSSQDKLGTFKIGTSTNAANLFVYNGNIGISTTTAGYGLTLDKGDSVSSIFVANGRVVGLKWIPVTNDEAASKYYVDQAVLGLNYWSINGSNNIYNNNSGGMVGIGTNNPTYQLDVAGQGRFISPNNAPVNSYRQTTPDGLLWSTLRLERTLTSGTAQNGSGAAIFFRTQNDSGASTIAGFLGGGLSTVTTGSEIGFLGFKASFNGHDPGTLNNFGLKLT